jgi:hypothetical protein
MSSLSGSVDARIQDGQILGINVPKMVRTLTARTLTGWQESRTESTDLSDLSASFRLEDGRATTSVGGADEHTFFGDGQAKGGLGEMPSASRRDTVPCMHSGESGKCGQPVL